MHGTLVCMSSTLLTSNRSSRVTTLRALAAVTAATVCSQAMALEPSITCKGEQAFPNQRYSYSLTLAISGTRITALDWQTSNAIGDAEPRVCSMQKSQITHQERPGDAYEATLAYIGQTATVMLRAVDARRFRLTMPQRPDAWCGGTGSAAIPVDIDFTARSCTLAITTRTDPPAATRKPR
jgi:hypothetical protein